jgi:hypothetical protein
MATPSELELVVRREEVVARLRILSVATGIVFVALCAVIVYLVYCPN